MWAFLILGCDTESSRTDPPIMNCLGSTQVDCASNDGCTVVVLPEDCMSEDCDQLYIGCLPVNAGCADRDEALCAVSDRCLKLYSSTDEFLRCDTEACETDSDCSLIDGYACFDGFIDGQKRCRQAPIECSNDDECPMGHRCDAAGEMSRVCVQ